MQSSGTAPTPHPVLFPCQRRSRAPAFSRDPPLPPNCQGAATEHYQLYRCAKRANYCDNLKKSSPHPNRPDQAHSRVVCIAGIPPAAFDYRLGNRSALEWVIDQYQVSTDKRSGIVSDPNREDDPEYVVRLVGQVVRVSLETVKIVNDLPAEFEPK